jgi:Rrf2 family protein
MHLTKESEYALLGLAALASRPSGSVVSLAVIAETEGLPRTFLSKIFRKLSRHQLLTSARGRGRGYALARPPESIPIQEVLNAVEGSSVFRQCLLWSGNCSEDDPCPLHPWLTELRPGLEAVLEQTTLADYMAHSGHFKSHISMLQKRDT